MKFSHFLESVLYCVKIDDIPYVFEFPRYCIQATFVVFYVEI